MKTIIIETLLLLLLIVSGAILYTLDKNTQGDTTIHSNTIHPDKEIHCLKFHDGHQDYYNEWLNKLRTGTAKLENKSKSIYFTPNLNISNKRIVMNINTLGISILCFQ